MRTVDIVRAREQAEKAVGDMPEGPMKHKAFEVILGRLLDKLETGSAREDAASRSRPVEAVSKQAIAKKDSTAGRILALKDEGFFKEQRSITALRDELRAHGWHYPLTTLSPRLVELVQKRSLRREIVKEGNKRIWKYSNP